MLFNPFGLIFIAIGALGVFAWFQVLQEDEGAAMILLGFGLFLPIIVAGIGVLILFPDLARALFM